MMLSSHAAEIVKRRILGLHQNTEIGSVDITDTWEPLEEGLNRLETTRHVSVITITLSTVPLDPTSIGYQAPLEEEFVKPLQESTAVGRGGGGSGSCGPGRWAHMLAPCLGRHLCSHPSTGEMAHGTCVLIVLHTVRRQAA